MSETPENYVTIDADKLGVYVALDGCVVQLAADSGIEPETTAVRREVAKALLRVALAELEAQA